MLPTASSSRSKQPSSSSSSSAAAADFPTKPFTRLRSSLEQSIRTATRSKKQAPPVDDFATITPKTSKGKEREDPQKDKEKHGMLRRLESKVNFRRGGRESVTPAPSPIPPAADETTHKVRLAGFASFVTPSLRQGSMSSPALHLSSQALPSPKVPACNPRLIVIDQSYPRFPVATSSRPDTKIEQQSSVANFTTSSHPMVAPYPSPRNRY